MTTRPIGETAVVVGASMAGLSAARVLSDRFDKVIVVERDHLPDGPEWRSQVPQGRHPHLLLTAGVRLLDAWFPGFTDELVRDGAIDMDVSADFFWHQNGGVWRRPATTLRAPAMSRPFLERAVRRRVESLPNVVICDGTTVSGLDADASGQGVAAVRLDGGVVLPCDLVVDASGRQARSLPWVEALGYEPPAVSTVAVDMRYVTRLYRRTDGSPRDWKAAAVVDDPASKRLAMVLPMEGDRWFVTFGGLNGETAPTDEAGALAYARTFGSPVVADVIETSEPLGDAVVHRFPANQRRHVEKMRRFPLGWVLLGDAVCSFDPIYGQGMTSAAQQAEALGTALDRVGAVDASFTRRYFRAAGKVVAVPWSMAVGGDFVYEGTTGNKPPGTDLVNRYMDKVFVAAQHDDGVVTRLNEAISMVRRPESLMAPLFVLRVLRLARRGPAETSGGTTAPSGARLGAGTAVPAS